MCEREGLKKLHQFVYFGGLMVGVVFAGWMADYFGRRFTLVPVTFAMAFFGTVSAFLPSMEWFIAARFFQGFATIGIFTIEFVWLIEQVREIG